MKYDIDDKPLKAEDTFEYHVLAHMVARGDISQEYYEKSMRELKTKYTKLAGLLHGENE